MPAEPALNKHQLKTETTKKKLFKAAQRVFARHGFEAATIDDIAKEAGYTRGAFYAHFDSKDDLFLALMEDRASAEFERLRAELLPADEGERLNIFRRFYGAKIHDKQWGLLMLEAKLYAARHAGAGTKLTDRLRALKTRLRQQYLSDLTPSALDEHRKRDRMLLEALLDGMILKRAYDPSEALEGESEQMLCDLFDAVQNGVL